MEATGQSTFYICGVHRLRLHLRLDCMKRRKRIGLRSEEVYVQKLSGVILNSAEKLYFIRKVIWIERRIGNCRFIQLGRLDILTIPIVKHYVLMNNRIR